MTEEVPMQVNVEMALNIQLLHSISVNREKLSDWHHKMRSKVFPLVVGFFVRCRVEDSNEGRALYKVGRIRNVKPDWTVELDLLTFDDIKAGRANTNYDCISNAKISDTEFNTFITKISQEAAIQIVCDAHATQERLKIMETILFQEPAFLAKKTKGIEPLAPSTPPSHVPGVTAPPPVPLPMNYTFSNNVLLIGRGDVSTMTVNMKELITMNLGPRGEAEPDTPRLLGGGAAAKPGKSAFDDKMASNSTMIQLDQLDRFTNSPSAPLPDPARLMQLIRRSGNETYTAFNYDNIATFCNTILSVCNTAKEIISQEPLYVHLQSPLYVFGDIHGNFADMYFFLQDLVAFDDPMLKFTSARFLFLGDYVDRGAHSIECIAYLLAMKCIAPNKITLLRGNHESPEVNGDMDCYGYSSFKYQCLDKFGREKGVEVWIAFNEVFAQLPIIAEIDSKVFCVHGGLPQHHGGEDRRLEVLADPNFPRIPVVQCNDPASAVQRMIVNDCLWSDPAAPSTPVDKYGFGPNPRGPDIKTFGSKAVDMFCERYGFQYIFRAHQEKADGLRISDSARVVTIFSTSDYAGHQNGAGCVFVAEGKIRMGVKRAIRDVVESPRKSVGTPRSLSGKTTPTRRTQSPTGMFGRGGN